MLKVLTCILGTELQERQYKYEKEVENKIVWKKKRKNENKN